MIVIWSGWGLIVIVIGLASYWLTEMATNSYFNDLHYYEAHGWPKLIAFWIAAAISFACGRMMNRHEERDPRTGERVIVRNRFHTFFWISLEEWGVVFFGLGIVFLFVGVK